MFSTTNVFPSTKSTAAGHHFPHLITAQQDAGGQSSATATGYPTVKGSPKLWESYPSWLTEVAERKCITAREPEACITSLY